MLENIMKEIAFRTVREATQVAWNLAMTFLNREDCESPGLRKMGIALANILDDPDVRRED